MGVSLTRACTFVAALALAGPAGGCAYSFKLEEPPPRMVEVRKHEDAARYKSADNVGANIHTFHNRKGGTLVYWAGDLVSKLDARGYRLVQQRAAKSANGVVGTRFDFRYTPPTDTRERFYTVVLFVGDETRTVFEVAGLVEHAPRHEATIEYVIDNIEVYCPNGGKLCEGPQPDSLVPKGDASAQASSG